MEKKIWLYNHPDRLFRLYLLCSLCITDSEMVASLMLIILLPSQQARLLPLLLGPWKQGCRGWTQTGQGASTHRQGAVNAATVMIISDTEHYGYMFVLLWALTIAMLVVSRLRLRLKPSNVWETIWWLPIKWCTHSYYPENDLKYVDEPLILPPIPLKYLKFQACRGPDNPAAYTFMVTFIIVLISISSHWVKIWIFETKQHSCTMLNVLNNKKQNKHTLICNNTVRRQSKQNPFQGCKLL